MGTTYVPEAVGSGVQTTSTLNDNFTNIQTALAATLSRAGTAPNGMSADIDLNSNDLLNVANINTDAMVLGGVAVTGSANLVQTQFVENVTALAATTFAVGTIVETKGYAVKGDGGQARYLIQTSAEFGATPDELGDHTDANSNVAAIQTETMLSLKQLGCVGDDVADDTTALIAACVRGTDLIVNDGLTFKITTVVAMPTGCVLHGPGTLNLAGIDGTVYLTMTSASNAGLKSVILTGTGNASIAGRAIRMSTTDNCFVSECDFTDIEGSGVELNLTAVSNIVTKNKFTDCSGFGIVLDSAANANEISFNKTKSNGLELIGLKQNSFYNRIIGNIAENTGDNGISISGFRNSIVGNTCVTNQKAGIWIWGGFNTVTGNTCLNNNQIASTWAGIGASSNFGGTGQNNIISANICEDTQAVATQHNGVRLGGTGYSIWVTATAYTASTDFVTNGLNIYLATTTGTSGATAPTHTSGDVSDGGVTWRFIRTFNLTASGNYNNVSDNMVLRSASDDYFDVTGFSLNSLNADVNQISTGQTNHQISGIQRIEGATTIFLNINGTDELRVTSTEMRPEADLGSKLGLTNRRFSEVHSNAFFSGASGATVKVVGARQTGWTAPTGTSDRTTFATSTVTLPELAERVKALIDDTTTHGLIGT